MVPTWSQEKGADPAILDKGELCKRAKVLPLFWKWKRRRHQPSCVLTTSGQTFKLEQHHDCPRETKYPRGDTGLAAGAWLFQQTLPPGGRVWRDLPVM